MGSVDAPRRGHGTCGREAPDSGGPRRGGGTAEDTRASCGIESSAGSGTGWREAAITHGIRLLRGAVNGGCPGAPARDRMLRPGRAAGSCWLHLQRCWGRVRVPVLVVELRAGGSSRARAGVALVPRARAGVALSAAGLLLQEHVEDLLARNRALPHPPLPRPNERVIGRRRIVIPVQHSRIQLGCVS